MLLAVRQAGIVLPAWLQAGIVLPARLLVEIALLAYLRTHHCLPENPTELALVLDLLI